MKLTTTIKMRNILAIIFLIFLTNTAVTQTDCNPPTNLLSEINNQDVTLTWSEPDFNPVNVLSAKPRINKDSSIDGSPIHKTIKSTSSQRDYLDVQFAFNCVDSSGETGVVSDGSFIYTSIWNKDYFLRYSIDGTSADTLIIPGVDSIRNMIYCEKNGLIYGSHFLNNSESVIYGMDFETLTLVESIEVPFLCRALGYNPTEDVFYTNNWDDDVKVVERTTGNIINTIPLNGSYGSYYGFAYDNVSDGGPYLWGFSHDGNGAELVQLDFPDLTETGFIMDVSEIGSGSNAGGLFIKSNLVDNTYTLGGIIQNDVIFGLELGEYTPPVLTGYNVYRNGIQINTDPVVNSLYTDYSLDPGTYTYEVTALYDISGSFYCESDPSNSVVVTIIDNPLILGGNVFAGSGKLDFGIANAYSFLGDDYILESSTDIDEFGYYFFFPVQPNYYYVSTHPDDNSQYKDSHINTYYGNVYHWEDSPPIHLENNLYNLDIELIEIAPLIPGAGMIAGKIISENKERDTNPAKNVSLLLLNSDDECIANVFSNESGDFKFSDLGNGTYKVLCEIMGKKMTPLEFTIDNHYQIYSNVNLLISEEEITLGIDDELPESVTFLSDIFPNPATNDAYIEISLMKNETVKFKLLSISGKVVESRSENLNTGLNRIIVSNSQLSAGIHFLNIEFENSFSINKKFIVY